MIKFILEFQFFLMTPKNFLFIIKIQINSEFEEEIFIYLQPNHSDNFN
jgi:hypothetical protein